MCRKRQRGFGIIAAIVILVIFAGLAAAIVVVSTAQHVGSALDIQGARAYLAARSGIERGLHQALQAAPACDAATDIGPLDGLRVTVGCVATASGDATEAGLGTIYTITAVACNLPAAATPRCPGDAANANYIERRLAVVAER